MKLFSIKNRQTGNERMIAVERPRLLQYACYRLGNMTDAEDVVQDTLASLHQRMQEDDLSISNLSGYLYRSLSNRCVSYQRAYILFPLTVRRILKTPRVMTLSRNTDVSVNYWRRFLMSRPRSFVYAIMAIRLSRRLPRFLTNH